MEAVTEIEAPRAEAFGTGHARALQPGPVCVGLKIGEFGQIRVAAGQDRFISRAIQFSVKQMAHFTAGAVVAIGIDTYNATAYVGLQGGGQAPVVVGDVVDGIDNAEVGRPGVGIPPDHLAIDVGVDQPGDVEVGVVIRLETARAAVEVAAYQGGVGRAGDEAGSDEAGCDKRGADGHGALLGLDTGGGTCFHLIQPKFVPGLLVWVKHARFRPSQSKTMQAVDPIAISASKQASKSVNFFDKNCGGRKISRKLGRLG